MLFGVVVTQQTNQHLSARVTCAPPLVMTSTPTSLNTDLVSGMVTLTLHVASPGRVSSSLDAGEVTTFSTLQLCVRVWKRKGWSAHKKERVS